MLLTINEETKSILWWAKNYELEPATLRSRYDRGLRGHDLLEPLPKDKLDEDIVHRRWGGRWVYTGKKTPKRYNENKRWIYVPNAK